MGSTWVRSIDQILFDPQLDTMEYRKLLDGIPRLTETINVAPGARILVRADIDVPLDESQTTVLDNERLVGVRPTLEVCWKLGAIPILFGHVGRDKNNTARAIAEELQKLFGRKCTFIPDWLDEEVGVVTPAAKIALAAMTEGSMGLLEQTRKYDLERILWRVSKASSHKLPERIFDAARSVATEIADYYVFDALASHNRDWSSVVVPGACKASYIGPYTINELAGPLLRIRQADIILLGGLKIDKLDALEGIVERAASKHILCAGSIAMSLAKARGMSIGLAENEQYRDKKWYVSEDRVEQARRILSKADALQVEISLPTDFVLDNGIVANEIPADRSQLDIGPRSRDDFCKIITDVVKVQPKATVFYNGSVGAFESEQFAGGTATIAKFLSGLRETFPDVGLYVGGGDGRLAFTRYGDVKAVTHIFTCGGTVLKVMGTGNVNYLKALWSYAHQRP